MTTDYVQPTVEMVVADLQRLDDPKAWLLVEVDGNSRPPKGIQRAILKLPDGSEQIVVIIVGSDYPGYQNDAAHTAEG